MNREFARILVCLMDKELNLPSMVLEQIEEKLVKGQFDQVHKFYCEYLAEKQQQEEERRKNDKYAHCRDLYCATCMAMPCTRDKYVG